MLSDDPFVLELSKSIKLLLEGMKEGNSEINDLMWIGVQLNKFASIVFLQVENRMNVEGVLGKASCD